MTNNNDDKINKTLETALKLLEQGFSVIPVQQDKTPYFKIGVYQRDRRATKEEVSKWFLEDYPNAKIAICTGKISGITVIDVDTYKGAKELPISTAKQITQRGGIHYICSYDSRYPTKAPLSKSHPYIDCRADGGYIVVYNPEVFIREDFKYIPEDLFNLDEIEQHRRTDWSKIVDRKNPKGTRNDALIQHGGKLLCHLPKEDWDTFGWESFKAYDFADNEPPYQEEYGIDYIKKKWNSLVDKEQNKMKEQEKESISKGKNGKKLQDEVLEIIEQKINSGEVILFKSETEEPFARIKINDHYEIVSLDSKTAKTWISKCCWEECKESIGSEALTSVLNNLVARARFDGIEYKLHNRVAKYDGSIWYDLTDKEYRAIKINEDGWEIINEPPILFKRYSHQKAQIEPQKHGDLKKLLKYVNVKDKNHEILLLVAIISYFMPGFPHPIINVYGVQGSAKSTLLKLVKKIVDPSVVETTSLKSDSDEFIQYLDHHWFSAFDNISRIGDSCSDILCRAISGDGHSKRKLYGDDDDFIRNFQRCVGLNGINMVTNKPDLLERSILIELERIPEDKRQLEGELIKGFEIDKPSILGGILDAVTSAIKFRKNVALTNIPRMADFTVWGCAIAEALGYTQQGFLNAYYSNIEIQNDEAINADITANLIKLLMKQEHLWEGTATKLLSKLEIVAENNGIDVNSHKDFPKIARTLSKKINQLKTNLEQIGIKITSGKDGDERFIKIEKVGRSINDSVNNLYNSGHAEKQDTKIEGFIKKLLILKSCSKDEISECAFDQLGAYKSTVDNAIKELLANRKVYLGDDNKYYLIDDCENNNKIIPSYSS